MEDDELKCATYTEWEPNLENNNSGRQSSVRERTIEEIFHLLHKLNQRLVASAGAI